LNISFNVQMSKVRIQSTHFVAAKNREIMTYVQITTRYDEMGRMLSGTFKMTLIIAYWH
jgi:hypothetical protein